MHVELERVRYEAHPALVRLEHRLQIFGVGRFLDIRDEGLGLDRHLGRGVCIVGLLKLYRRRAKIAAFGMPSLSGADTVIRIAKSSDAYKSRRESIRYRSGSVEEFRRTGFFSDRSVDMSHVSWRLRVVDSKN